MEAQKGLLEEANSELTKWKADAQTHQRRVEELTRELEHAKRDAARGLDSEVRASVQRVRAKLPFHLLSSAQTHSDPHPHRRPHRPDRLHPRPSLTTTTHAHVL